MNEATVRSMKTQHYVCLLSLTDDGVQEVRVIQLCDDVTVLLFVFVDEEGNQVILAASSGMYHSLVSP